MRKKRRKSCRKSEKPSVTAFILGRFFKSRQNRDILMIKMTLFGRDLLSVLFYVASGVVRGTIRLQKTVFLLQQELGVGSFAFSPSKYGPWSKDLADALRELESLGLLHVSKEETAEGTVTVYRADKRLLDEGHAKFRELLMLDPALAVKLYRYARICTSLPLTYLLAYVYKNYPEYVLRRAIQKVVRK